MATVLPAFTDLPDGKVRFVQHRVWAERARIAGLFGRGAIVFVCGDGDEAAQGWADDVEHVQGRYVSDVFA